MRSGVIAQKLGMTRVFTEAGEHVPVTVLRLGNCQVLGHRTKEKNGYVALQLGSGSRKVNNVSKAERGNFAVAKVEPKRKLAEFRVSDDALIPVGAEITADHFVVGQYVDERRESAAHLHPDRGWHLEIQDRAQGPDAGHFRRADAKGKGAQRAMAGGV